MKYIFLLVVIIVTHMEGISQEVRFIGYKDGKAVFSVKSRADGQKEHSLFMINDQTNQSAVTESDPYLEKVFSYSGQLFVGYDEFGDIMLVSPDSSVPLKFQEDFSDEDRFTDKLEENMRVLGQVPVVLSSEGREIVYPKHNSLKVIRKKLSDQSKEETDYSHISVNSGSVIGLGETTGNYYLMVSNDGPYEFYEVSKSGKNYKKAPFTLGHKGGFGLKYHPDGNEIAMIYKDLPVLYRFDSDKFQVIRSKKLPSGKKLEDAFAGVYATKNGDWRVAYQENDALVSVSLGAGRSASDFSLNLDELEEEVEKEKVKNMSAMDELRALLREYSPRKQTLTATQKQEVARKLEQFIQKYADKTANDPMIDRAVQTVSLLQLDTTYVPVATVMETEKTFLQMIKDERLDFNPLMGAQLLKIKGMDPTPVHEPRVRVLEALVEDYLDENEINNNQAIQSSGLEMLILAYKANENYPKALSLHKRFMEYLQQEGVNYSMKDVYVEHIFLLLQNEQYSAALDQIEAYRSEFVREEGKYINEKVQADIMKVSALGGLKKYNEAFALIEDLKMLMQNEGDRIFGSGTKEWMKYSLLFAEAEIHFEKSRKTGKQKIEQLVNYVAGKKEDFQYSKMYSTTKRLLETTSQTDLLNDLPDPAK